MNMNAGEDDDLRLLRSSALLLADIEKLLPRLLRKKRADNYVMRYQVKEVDMRRLVVKIEPFQEDPQLLDTHLKTFLPPLVSAYLEIIQSESTTKPKKGYLPTSHVICQILNLFCKVRGEKVIKGFLNNEPRYLEPILTELERGRNFVREDGESLPQCMLPWVERYIQLLWLSHLMLAPFPLASMSVLKSSKETSAALGVELPLEVPEVSIRTLVICVDGLKSASKERGAAANLLVRLCVRPDMQALGLLSAIVTWALSSFEKVDENPSNIHRYLGILSFLAGLVSSATNEELGPFLSDIYRTCHNIISDESLSFVKSSAVARKMIIKSFRNIVVHSLQDTSSVSSLDPTMVVEEVVEFLLDALADGDTPVRYSASKALSIITMKLDPEMSAEVVDAILGSLNENVYWEGSQRNLSGVNPLRWHGLTLTLSHLLYRRAVSTSQLPDILNALLLALAFEQRSATGRSIGTNVRDAACFGIWALARRYTTNELLAVRTSSVRASEHLTNISILQVVATELLVVACLDPAGNIRRGSSAALQELVGRHPDTVSDGIPLVQIVDFHAVGLRERAMCTVAVNAAKLQQTYWDALFQNLLGWRGTGSLDAPSRLFAASAVGLLSADKDQPVIMRVAEEVVKRLKILRPREIEERQGFVMCLSALVNQSLSPQSGILETGKRTSSTRADLTHLWTLLDNALRLDESAFASPALRPEFTASAICNFLGEMAAMSRKGQHLPELVLPYQEMTRLLNLCLARHEDTVLAAIPKATQGVLELLDKKSPGEKDTLVSTWLDKLENEASYNGLRWSGYAIALGAAYPLLEGAIRGCGTLQNRIIGVLTFRCTSAVAVEARTVALRAMTVLLESYAGFHESRQLPKDVVDQICKALHISLNDYTVTERGDVGSLVRLEALITTGTAWSASIQFRNSHGGEQLHGDVLRLSVEKLDKIRARAAHVLEQTSYGEFEEVAHRTADGVSSYEYFANALKLFHQPIPDHIKEGLCLGLASSAGMGSESVVQNSRAALLDTLDSLPTDETSESGLTLLDVANCLLGLLKNSLDNDRTLLPLLEVIAFLFDMQVMQRMVTTTFNFRALLSYTQKAHFKSSHMQKLHLALDVYRGLANIPSTRIDTINKLASMLLHPFPNIRISSAETLWLLTQEQDLKRHDWSQPPKILKPSVEAIKTTCLSKPRLMILYPCET
ncbi:uncharacterized protein EI97DRAFT_192089 [Westerdykella ornata]|uniref:Uncharacterized protein n=1 Tax=Westerdykella ornata TaxID=318751 RepID=A0A6A6J9R4_WESOR|nr:uncharacterized protein EI97DRAFT_192089 [Westerdykella ornata]KAF2272997.1 hypothetical protein EI97DRAFT_192089 [Westerdykella ornata]